MDVVLVDKDDNAIGIMEKMRAHREGKLHRAFSILLFNSQGEMLIQKRAVAKYHSGGLWTNACCSHPQPNEPIDMAARRRLLEELGIDAHPVFIYKFLYHVALDVEFTEHEVDYVFSCVCDANPEPNPGEVAEWKFVDTDTLRKEISENPDHYTYWFRLIMAHPQFEKLLEKL